MIPTRRRVHALSMLLALWAGGSYPSAAGEIRWQFDTGG